MARDEAKRKASQAAYCARNPEKVKASQAAYRVRNPEEVKARTAAWRAANPEQIKAYNVASYAANTKQERARHVAWRAANPGQAKARDTARYAANPERERARSAVWRVAHPEQTKAANLRHRARKANAPINDFTAAQWKAMKEHYNYCCVYCKEPKPLTQDHIFPLSKGGSHTLSNIVPACRRCNSKKGVGPVLVPVQPLLLVDVKPEPKHRKKG